MEKDQLINGTRKDKHIIDELINHTKKDKQIIDELIKRVETLESKEKK